MKDITMLVEIIIGIVSVVVSSALVPWLVKKFGAEKLSQIAYWVKTLVQAAEQLFKTATKAGEQKKAYVLTELEKIGITYDKDKINALIEAEVLKLAAEKTDTGTNAATSTNTDARTNKIVETDANAEESDNK